jgi:hypothetical protein
MPSYRIHVVTYIESVPPISWTRRWRQFAPGTRPSRPRGRCRRSACWAPWGLWFRVIVSRELCRAPTLPSRSQQPGRADPTPVPEPVGPFVEFAPDGALPTSDPLELLGAPASVVELLPVCALAVAPDPAVLPEVGLVGVNVGPRDHVADDPDAQKHRLSAPTLPRCFQQ